MDNQNNNHVYEEYVIEVLENSGTLDNGKKWENYTIVSCLHRDGKPYKTEFYKGSPARIDKVFNLSTVDEVRKSIKGQKIISYSFDKYGKINSFICADTIDPS